MENSDAYAENVFVGKDAGLTLTTGNHGCYQIFPTDNSEKEIDYRNFVPEEDSEESKFETVWWGNDDTMIICWNNDMLCIVEPLEEIDYRHFIPRD